MSNKVYLLQDDYLTQEHSSLFSICFTQINQILQKNAKAITNEELLRKLLKSNFLPDYLITKYLDDIQRNEVYSQLKYMFFNTFWKIGSLKLISVIFLFTTPIIMNYLTLSLNETVDKFAYFSIALLLSTLIASVSDTQYYYQIKILETECRIYLTKAIYKSLDSDSKLDVMNLINIDINTVINFFLSFHEFWSLIVKLIIGMLLLYMKIRETVFVGFITAMILVLVNFKIAKQIGSYYFQGLKFKDQRMKVMKDFISNPKAIKFLKWETKQINKLESIRQQEFTILQGSKWLDSLCVLFWAITNTMISTTTLFVYQKSNELDDVFTIIYLFSLLTTPLNSLPWTASGMIQAKTSLVRIEEFLRNNSYKQPILNQQKLLINQAELKWDFDDQFLLKIPNLKSSQLIFVVGQTGSGKTSFALALLGQMKKQSGYFEINCNFSYVPQQHWICEGTIKENILMESEYNEVKYQRCLKDSLLEQDLQYLEYRDQFNVGPDGQRLSGGQKQRLSICRALYNEKDIYLFDDIFSSLDPKVADSIFFNIIQYDKPIIMILNDGYLERYYQYSKDILLIQNGIATFEQEEITKYITKLKVNQTENLRLNKNTTNNQQLLNNETLIIEKEKQEQNRSSLKFYLKMLGIGNAIWIIISLILMQASFNIYDIWLNSYINGTSYFLFRGSFSITLIILTSFDVLIKASRAFSFAYGNLIQAKRIFSNLIRQIINAKSIFFDKEESGQILTRFSDDQNVVDNRFPFEFNILCNNIVNFIGTFVTLIILEWFLIIPTVIAFIIFYQLQQLYRPTSLQLRRQEQMTNATLLTCLFQQYKGITIIKAFNKQLEYKLQFIQNLTYSVRASWASKVLALWLQIRLQFIATFIVFCILMFTIVSLYFDFSISQSTLSLLLYYALTKISIFRDLTQSLTTCEQEMISYERIMKYQKVDQEEDQEVEQILLDSQEDIEFQDVTLQYDNGVVALKNINLHIKKGEKIAFCGRTGSGKSSILSALFMLYPYQYGKIKVTKKSLFQWRASVGVIPQHGYILEGTIMENLENENVDQILEVLPNTDPYQIVDSNTISQGERQLVSFARVILSNCDIICLDEATASVDRNIEEMIHKFLKESQKTIIMISHKLDQLGDFDCIYYMENGSIVESGSYQELIEQHGGFYELRNRQ